MLTNVTKLDKTSESFCSTKSIHFAEEMIESANCVHRACVSIRLAQFVEQEVRKTGDRLDKYRVRASMFRVNSK